MTKVDIKDSKKKLQAKYYYNAICAKLQLDAQIYN